MSTTIRRRLEKQLQKAGEAEDFDNMIKIHKEIELLKEDAAELAIQKEEAEAIKKKKKQKEDEYKEKAMDAEIALREHNYQYISSSHTYIVKNTDPEVANEYVDVCPASLSISNPSLSDKLTLRIFKELMKDEGRCYLTRTYSLRDNVPADTLNLMTYENWIQPQFSEGGYHPAFDALFAALGNGKKKNIEHLEHVITYKYCNPSTYMLPCIIIYGDGSVGKNVLVDVLLHTLFAGQTTSFEGSKMFGNFQSNIVGKTVILMNELKRLKANMEVLKNTVMTPRLVINEKNVKEYTADNTPLYFIGSNDPHGPITLVDDGSDRRWSILRVPYSSGRNRLMEKLNKHCEEEVVNLGQLSDIIESIFKNPKEVANWIAAMIIKYGREKIPEALLDEDAEHMKAAQQSSENAFYDLIFNHEDFTAIKFQDAWVLYKQYMKSVSAPGVSSMTFQKENMRVWIEKHSGFEWKNGSGNGGVIGIGRMAGNSRVSTSGIGVIKAGRMGHHEEDMLAFIDTIKAVIVGQEVLETTLTAKARRNNILPFA